MTQVRGEDVPVCLEIYFVSRKNAELCRVAFLVGQEELLRKNKIIKPKTRSRGIGIEDPDLFKDFAMADTYQVHPSMIESLTDLQFAPATDPIVPERLSRVVLKEVEIKGRGLGLSDDNNAPEIEGLVF